MVQAQSDIGEFLATLRAIHRAWIILDQIQPNDATSVANIIAAAELGHANPHILSGAAALLATIDPDAAHDLLEQAVARATPLAPAQLALARSFRVRGDDAQASRWLRGALLRLQPEAGRLLELSTVEPGNAGEIVETAKTLPYRDAAAAMDAAAGLIAIGKRKEARIACTIAFLAGARDDDFLVLYSDLLSDRYLHEDLPLPAGPLGMPHWWQVATFAAQARLGRFYSLPQLIAHAKAREASDRWIGADRIGAFLKERITSREPFSWIRLGDGEARFLMHLHPALRTALPAREAAAVTKHIWFAWFGQDIDLVPKELLESLGARLGQAIRNADFLGITSAERLTTDLRHNGFCAALEHHLSPLIDNDPDVRLSDACAHTAYNERDPFFASLLGGIDFLGVISPHPELAQRLQRHLGIGEVTSYVIPGESRLQSERERSNRGTHFPAEFDDILATLSIPQRGAVFLVAGGLLGKVYCDQVRRLGGIALDIGAVADAWMGHNSRPGALDRSMQWQLPA